jgi:hypothetical protein
MSQRTVWSVVLVIVGLLAMLIGTVDPLEGAFIILPGSAVVTAGAFLGKSRYQFLLSWAFVLIAAGVGAMVVFTAMGGIGGHSGRSIWWGMFVLPYPIGWIMGLVGAILRLIEQFQRPAPERERGQVEREGGEAQ